jgi:hypothetical protein
VAVGRASAGGMDGKGGSSSSSSKVYFNQDRMYVLVSS